MSRNPQNKERLGVTVDREVFEWLQSKVADKTFATLSHGVEYCLFQEMKRQGGQSDRF